MKATALQWLFSFTLYASASTLSEKLNRFCNFFSYRGWKKAQNRF